MLTNACVFCALALATDGHVQLKSEVLRLVAGSLSELHDDIVAIAFRELRLADECIALFHELKLLSPVLRDGEDDNALRGSGDWFHLFIVEVNGDSAVFFDDELGMWLGFVEQTSALRRGLVVMVMVVSGNGGERETGT